MRSKSPQFHQNGAAHEVPAYVAQKALLVAQFLAFGL